MKNTLNAKSFKVGSSIKVIDRAGKESFLTVEMQGGDIALMNKSGTTAMTRKLFTDGDTQFFQAYGQIFSRKAI